MIFPITLLTVVAITHRHVHCDREHKVHNIVLYPDRHSWCQTTPIKQIVAMPGFEPMTIDNNVCVGACYSYSIPRTEPSEPGELIGPYCDSCQPLETKCYHVTLQSESQENETPKKIQKRVQIITNCSCASCNKQQSTDCEISDANTSELPTNLFSVMLHVKKAENKPELEVPELLNLAPPNNRSMQLQQLNTSTNEQRYEINSKLINLLKSIQNQEDDGDDVDSNLNYDREQLKKLLDIIEGSEHQLSDKNLMDFVNFVNVHNSEDLELDLSRLKEVLENFRRERDLLEKHRDFGLGNVGVKTVAEPNADLVYHPKIFGNDVGIGHIKGSHAGMGVQTNLDNSLVEAKVAHHKTDEIKANKKMEEATGSKGHHRLGEVQHLGTKLGHLIQGPHGSLVLTPDNINVEEKLNLNSDEIRPNHDGAVISYENHHRIHHGHHKLQTTVF